MFGRVMIDSFSGAAADLNPKQRNSENVLRVLSKDPLVSTFDMSELKWLRVIIGDLEREGLIKAEDEPYPWHRYSLTEAGRKELR